MTDSTSDDVRRQTVLQLSSVARTMYAATSPSLSPAARMAQVFTRNPYLRDAFERYPELEVPDVDPKAVATALARTAAAARERRIGAVQPASTRVMALARETVEKDPTLSLQQAIRIALKRNPALYEQYRRESITSA